MKRFLTILLIAVSITGLSAQSLTSIYPTSGHEGDVALTEQIDGYGTHFAQATTYHITLHLGNNSITGYNVQVVSTGRLTVDFDIPFNFPEGTYYLTLAGGVDSFTTINPVYVVYAPATSGITAIGAGLINAYPIPAFERLYVKLPEGNAIQTIAVISLSGQILLNQPATGNAEECINLHNFAAGMYIIEATDQNGVLIRKKIMLD